MGGGTGNADKTRHEEISEMIRRAPNTGLCKMILLHLEENQDLDGFDHNEMRKALKVRNNRLDLNLFYLKGAGILNEDYHMTPSTKEYVEDKLKKK